MVDHGMCLIFTSPLRSADGRQWYMGVGHTNKQESAKEVNSGDEISSAAPARNETLNVPITSLSFYQLSYSNTGVDNDSWLKRF